MAPLGLEITPDVLPDELAEHWNGSDRDRENFSRTLGKAFSRHEEERFGDSQVRICRAGRYQRATRWKVELDIPPAKSLRQESMEHLTEQVEQQLGPQGGQGEDTNV